MVEGAERKFDFPFYIEKDNFYFSRVNSLYTKGVFTVMYGNFVDFCYNYLERHINSDFKMVFCADKSSIVE